MSVSSKQFRQQSATESRSIDLKNNPTRDDQESCHKIPNSILKESYNNTTSQAAKNDIMGHAHSTNNIFYSTNNNQHSQQEYNLQSDNYTQSSVYGKGGQIENSLYKLHHTQDSAATTNIMRTMINSGPGYTEIVANLDKRQFNNPSEKQQIDIFLNQRIYKYAPSPLPIIGHRHKLKTQ
ncbi:hypothetical protein PPL_08219 [Heterostelium album PN500]|uniref:Uncharacterized protein n=1 Tax=Heterostelium pallidum (strain ATCC 26659 / Pp 5 / PN500) TaxID=670386 RepID=D3BIY4_HETP5|nr:hypothetical protein PPL_08219 [Heterostelium album PN500]EFA78758.1 hypothetical protein PPL_08219 [Heterostelium album PN500]|eukprot:XP_020430882.1 hypothetical protein PPL_08219 [Heterostelium album PN500]